MRLSKREVFSACQALADADRCLVRAGRLREAGALADLFQLLEARLVAGDLGPVGPGSPGVQCSAGSYSMESELTQ